VSISYRIVARPIGIEDAGLKPLRPPVYNILQYNFYQLSMCTIYTFPATLCCSCQRSTDALKTLADVTWTDTASIRSTVTIAVSVQTAITEMASTAPVK